LKPPSPSGVMRRAGRSGQSVLFEGSVAVLGSFYRFRDTAREEVVPPMVAEIYFLSASMKTDSLTVKDQGITSVWIISYASHQLTAADDMSPPTVFVCPPCAPIRCGRPQTRGPSQKPLLMGKRSRGGTSWRARTAAVKRKGHVRIGEEERTGPQSLNTNVLLMPRCEGHQEHTLKGAFIAASVYDSDSLHHLSSDAHFSCSPSSNQFATLQPPGMAAYICINLMEFLLALSPGQG
ncbi:hypothetical protein GOODEAATRI_002439, partial [Goodea atripinnis]